MNRAENPKVVFIGDTSLRTSHFGCQLVGQTFREQFSRVNLDLVASLPSKLEQIPRWREHVAGADLVVINGEGSIHHGRFQDLINLASDYSCALVNCVYQENPCNENLTKFKYVSTRESCSANAMYEHGVSAEIVPDVLFASTLLNSFVPKQQPVHEVGFTDCAQKEKFSFGPFSVRYRPGFSPKTPVVGEYLDFLCSHRRMALGRFHAVVCCSVLGIPFSTWDSNTWKTKGLMNDMGISELHFDSRKEALAHLPEVLPEAVKVFRADAKRSIETMFDTFAHIARGQ